MARPRIVLACLAVGLAAAVAGATTLERMDLEQLTSAARVVARVRCLENESRWEGSEIWTFTRFEVLETLKGSAPRTITVRLLGGRVGHWVASVDGVPRFRPGEELYLFLEPTRAGDLSVTSWAQGTFRIQRDRTNGEERVTQDTRGVTVFDPETRRFRAGGVRQVPLEQFRERVREAVERQARARTP